MTGTRAPMRCSYCGTVGHNRRSCAERKRVEALTPEERQLELVAAVDELDTPAGDSPKVPTGKRCRRCKRRGHRADRCLSPYPLVLLGDGQYTVPPDMLVIVMSRRYFSDSLNLDGRRDELIDVLLHGDGRARVYMRDRVDWRVSMGGTVPWVGTLRDLGEHWEAHAEGELCPVQVAVTVARKLCPSLALALPVWTEEDLT